MVIVSCSCFAATVYLVSALFTKNYGLKYLYPLPISLQKRHKTGVNPLKVIDCMGPSFVGA